MKKLSNILLFMTLAITAKAQNKPDTLPADTPNRKMLYSASALGQGPSFAIGIDKNTQWIEYHNIIANRPLDNYVFLKGTKNIVLFGAFNKDSLSYYRYNIIEDDVKLLATDAIPVLNATAHKFGHTVEIDLGLFNVQNKKLTIEAYKITSRSKVKATVIYNREIQPAKINIVARGVTGKKGDAVIMEHMKDGFKFKLYDKETVNALYVAIKPTDLTFLYTVYLKNLTTGEINPVSNNWQSDYFNDDVAGELPYLVISSSFFNKPGDYELQIIPKLPGGFKIKSFPEKTTTFHFTIGTSGKVIQEKVVVKYAMIGLIIIACLVFIGFYIIKIRNKRKLAEQQQQRDIAQLQLDAVRAQLNPHFLFNALSGIQNLINKAEIDQANRYLSKFARLTRNVLNNNGLIDLTEERKLLDDYLQMEQMRFGFNYEILTDDELSALHVMVPSMLLQPFVENAVKHGVASADGDAKIIINLQKIDADIEISITDNGKGFDTGKQTSGLGLQLSKKRIALLNRVYKDAPIVLDIQSGTHGTTVQLTLTHWL
jgi:two-component system LytT family sensor kinase